MKSEFIMKDCEYISSPNCDDRPNGVEVDTIVIHCISLPELNYKNNYVDLLFQNALNRKHDESFTELEGLKVSSHLLIKRSGEIVQYVPFDKRAWHAGESEYNGRTNVNDFSIGIELHGAISDTYTDNQYLELKKTIEYLKEIFPSIKDSNIIGHSDVAPGRKFDPGPHFIWDKIK